MALGKGLGKGLAALMGDEADETEQSAANVSDIDIDLIDANPWQPRTEFEQDELDELEASIRNVGIIQPLTLRRIEETNRYQIIAGERRFRAAKQAGLKVVPAYVRVVSDDKMLAIALIENIQRSNLNPIDEATSYQRLIDECNLTQETLADQVGKKRSTITNYLRLLKLPEEIQQGLRSRLITMGHARAIMGIDEQDTQLIVYHDAIEQGYSVRQIEELVRQYNDPGDNPSPDIPVAPTPKTKSKAETSEEYKALGEQLSSYFGTNVLLSCNKKGKGKITINFSSAEELGRVLEQLDVARQNNNAQ